MTSYESLTPDEMYDATTQKIMSLYGSFSLYNMRVVLSTADTALLAAQAQALRDSDISNVCFTENLLPSALSYSRPTVSAEEPEEEAVSEPVFKVEPETNPYASGSSSQAQDDTVSTEEAPVAEEDPVVSDSWYYDENGNLVRRWY